MVVAPTWLTHRRALLPLGETRRARAWTATAVRVAREAIEAGMERRAASADAADADDPVPTSDPTRNDPASGWPASARTPDATPPLLPRSHPVLAASLPALDEEPEPGTGRLLPREAASERDYVDQAGLLADAEPGLLLVEGQATLTELRLAVRAATQTGLPTWVAISGLRERWALSASLEWLASEPVDVVLLVARPDDPTARWGALTDSPEEARARLDEGALIVGLLDGASPARLRPLREVIDALLAAQLESAHESDRRWRHHVECAVAMASGGAAAWLGDQLGPLPAGFAWTTVPRDWRAALPTDHFRLVVIPPGGPHPHPVSPALERGGVLVARLDGATQAEAVRTGLRLLLVDDAEDPPLAIWRRED